MRPRNHGLRSVRICARRGLGYSEELDGSEGNPLGARSSTDASGVLLENSVTRVALGGAGYGFAIVRAGESNSGPPVRRAAPLTFGKW